MFRSFRALPVLTRPGHRRTAQCPVPETRLGPLQDAGLSRYDVLAPPGAARFQRSCRRRGPHSPVRRALSSLLVARYASTIHVARAVNARPAPGADIVV